MSIFRNMGTSVLLGLILNSFLINLLALTSPLFMLQIYDRVLASGSVPTLLGLSILAVGLYGFQSALDILRARILLRVGESFDRSYSSRVYDAVIRLPLITRMPGDGQQPLRDLDNVRSFMSGSGPTAVFDLPWIPLYLGLCFIFHFWLGITALAGAVILIAMTILTSLMSRQPARDTLNLNMTRNSLLETARRNAEVIQAMGLSGRLSERWQDANSAYLLANRRSGDVTGGFGGVSKTLRYILQSAILAVGAYLVIWQQASPGVMIAASIMMGRALAPVDLAIASWNPFLTARQSWHRLQDLLVRVPERPEMMALPAPEKELRVQSLAIVPPGERKPTVNGLNFAVEGGSALGIIGPSGSGKSTLARALVGAWLPAAGSVRLDGASLDHWKSEDLGRHIGYLPQGVELFGGTIAENIARFEDDPDPEAIVAASKTAGTHEMILAMENGYETQIGDGGSRLSSGQRQRLGLARALYGNPFLVVLDEPNANLDAEGEAAVVEAILSVRARKGIAIVVAHRPSAISVVDKVLVMDQGNMRAFGPKDEVLSRVLKVAPQPAAPAQPAIRQDIA
jgi:ATP-binding cassette subfamily C protein